VTITKRDSLMPRCVHECDAMPDHFPKNHTDLNLDQGTPDDLFFPTRPVRIIQHTDGQWYAIVQEEFVIPIEFCPFCGADLAMPEVAKNPPPPVNLGEEDTGADVHDFEIEAD